MKTILQKSQYLLWFIAVIIGIGQTVQAKDSTAFELVKEGNRYINEQFKDRVVQIRSEKSIGRLTPEIWYVAYYDADAVVKAVEVKFAAGKKMEVKRLLEPFTQANEPLPKDKLKVDSDRALDIASQDPLVEKFTLKASRLILERRSFDDATPVWKVHLWAARVSNPADYVDLGEVIISAADGTVLKSDLHPDRV